MAIHFSDEGTDQQLGIVVLQVFRLFRIADEQDAVGHVVGSEGIEFRGRIVAGEYQVFVVQFVGVGVFFAGCQGKGCEKKEN